MVLRADDGTPLEVKEPIVLDSDGNPQAQLHQARAHSQADGGFSSETPFSRTFYFSSLSGWLAPFFLILMGALLVFGTVFVGTFVALLVCLTFAKGLFRLVRQLFKNPA